MDSLLGCRENVCIEMSKDTNLYCLSNSHWLDINFKFIDNIMYVLGHLYKQVQEWNRNYVNGDNLNVNTLNVDHVGRNNVGRLLDWIGNNQSITLPIINKFKCSFQGENVLFSYSQLPNEMNIFSSKSLLKRVNTWSSLFSKTLNSLNLILSKKSVTFYHKVVVHY